ncbi:hypothetical protein DRN58_06630, partial [Thermococci archaeon]
YLFKVTINGPTCYYKTGYVVSDSLDDAYQVYLSFLGRYRLDRWHTGLKDIEVLASTGGEEVLRPHHSMLLLTEVLLLTGEVPKNQTFYLIKITVNGVQNACYRTGYVVSDSLDDAYRVYLSFLKKKYPKYQGGLVSVEVLANTNEETNDINHYILLISLDKS